MAHSTQFTFVAGDMTFTRILPSRRLAYYMGVQAIGVARRYDYWASRDYTKAVHFLTHLGPCSTRIVSEMVKEWEELLGDEDESGPQNIMLHNQFYIEITHFDLGDCMDDLLEMYNVALAERLADAANPVKLPVQNLHPDWPTDAEYRAVYRLQAWPTDAMNHVSYFASFEELDAWYTAQLKWTQLEDNYFWLDKLEHWDLGPQPAGLEILDRH